MSRRSLPGSPVDPALHSRRVLRPARAADRSGDAPVSSYPQPRGRTWSATASCAKARSSSPGKFARSSRATSCGSCSARRRRWRNRGCATLSLTISPRGRKRFSIRPCAGSSHAAAPVFFRDLVLDFTEQDGADPEVAARLLAEEVLSGRCPQKNWDDAVEQWFVRLACLRTWMPELELPEADEEARRAVVSQDLPWLIHLQGDQGRWMSGRRCAAGFPRRAQRWLDQFAPERLELPGGTQGEGHLHRRAARR